MGQQGPQAATRGIILCPWGGTTTGPDATHPQAVCQNLRGGAGGQWGGGGRGLARGCVWGGGGVGGSARGVPKWGGEGGQNKDHRHSNPFKEGRTSSKHIVPLSTKHTRRKKSAR